MRFFIHLAAAAAIAGLAAAPAFAADKMQLTPGAVEQIDTAAKLTNYGIDRNDPLLLLAAARLLSGLDADAAPVAAPMGPADLIARAKELAKGDAAIGTLAEQVEGEAARGLCYGPGTVYGCF